MANVEEERNDIMLRKARHHGTSTKWQIVTERHSKELALLIFLDKTLIQQIF